MQKFDGFKPGKHKQIAIPAQFFTDILPYLDTMAQVQVLLFCFRALMQKEGDTRYLRFTDFTHDTALNRALAKITNETEPLIRETLKQLVTTEILLEAHLAQDEKDTDAPTIYFMNTSRGRHIVTQIHGGNWVLEDDGLEILPERPNAYALYEENIGILTPHIADALRQAESDYPAHWLPEAIKLSVENNKRSWRYIEAILKRWQNEGRATHETPERPSTKRYTGGKYADFIES